MKIKFSVLLMLFLANGILAQTTQLTGFIKNTSGDIIYSKLIIANPVSFETISNSNECWNDVPFNLSIPKGQFRIIIQEIQPGSTALDLGVFDFQDDQINMDFIYEKITGTDPIQSASFSKETVYSDFTSPVQLSIKLEENSDVKEIYWINDLSGFTDSNGLEKYKFKLEENGNFFVSPDLLVNSEFELKRDGKLGSILAFTYEIVLNDNSRYFVFSSEVAKVKVLLNSLGQNMKYEVLNDSTLISDHVINILDDFQLDTFDSQIFNDHLENVLKQVHNLYGDQFDFVNILYLNNPYALTSVGSHFVTQNNVTGIGKAIFQNNILNDNLESVKGMSFFPSTSFSIPLNHETMHQWGNSIDSVFLFSAPGHWGYSSANGVMGGFAKESLTIINDNTVSLQGSAVPWGHSTDKKDFSPIERYLMGAIPGGNVTEEFVSLRNPQNIGGGNLSVDEILQFTIQDVISIYGERNTTSSDFNSVNVLISKDHVTFETMAFYDYLIRFWGNYEPMLHEFSYRSFESAAGGLAKMETRLPSVEIVDNDMDGFNSTEDCDDNNPLINPDQLEIEYNGIDDDCDDSTLDDDLDEDGFVLTEDCDDTNALINPNQTEVTYNGIDDDCNPSTLDDDLDEDGFILAEDCDDENSLINPDALEIPNNGIDEDCDGEDLMTANYELEESTINIYPNPATDIIRIDIDKVLDYQVSLINLNGKILLTNENISIIDVNSYPSGPYILELKASLTGKRIIELIFIQN